MLVLSVKVPDRSQTVSEPIERVLLRFPDGSEGLISFLYKGKKRVSVGFDFSNDVTIVRTSLLTDCDPASAESLEAFAQLTASGLNMTPKESRQR